MNKKNVKKLLENGNTIEDIFKLTAGQDCMIYKASWNEKSDEIIYIPDVELNNLDDKDMSINEKMSYMYTADDFIAECFGNVKLAKDLFDLCDWQNPNINDLIDCTDYEEGKTLYGDIWDEITSIPF